jgi:hypothetical protein
MRPSKTLTDWLRNRSLIFPLILLCLSLTFCSTSYASATLNASGDVVMSVEDARLLLAEVRGLRAENLALKEALASERADVDRLIEQTQKLMDAMEAERTAWKEKLAEEKKNGKKNAVIMLLVGLVAGGII